MMKKNIFLTFIMSLYLCCDPSSSALYQIKNETNYNGVVLFYAQNNETSFEINSNSTVTISKVGGFGVTDIDLNITDDSVIFLFEYDSKIIKFYKDSINENGKSIYNESSWEKTKISNHNYKFMFTISDNDLND